ncbi:MAG TPA: biotin/lipoyl-binding protein [bacterium]|nr:biotin/lipoyl-binding protein [bacterium]
MKMENEIKAPMAGKIKKFHVQGGKNVEKGQPLFVVEP